MAKILKGRNSQETQNRILKAAKTEFAQCGFEGARMENIAQRSGINKAMLHYYFTDKNTLYDTLVKNILTRENESILAELLQRYKLTPAEKLYIYIQIQTYTNLEFNDHESFILMHREIINNRTAYQPLIREIITNKTEILSKIITEGTEKSAFEMNEPVLLSLFINSFFINYMLQKDIMLDSEAGKRLYKQSSTNQMFSSITELIFRTLAPKNEPFHMPIIGKECRKALPEIMEYIRKGYGEN